MNTTTSTAIGILAGLPIAVIGITVKDYVRKCSLAEYNRNREQRVEKLRVGNAVIQEKARWNLANGLKFGADSYDYSTK